jgi:hypothetical protein
MRHFWRGHPISIPTWEMNGPHADIEITFRAAGHTFVGVLGPGRWGEEEVIP